MPRKSRPERFRERLWFTHDEAISRTTVHGDQDHVEIDRAG